ncbi:arginine--tRNA ligase [Actinomadura sp. KC345]|uniref:arginine--tRNA ligase n=1 Tax=Actinomadura sp. KC345 TaxID=2530371 RepID=UPI001FB5F583|nr:arginine--tRNA ligase [Actinomadura sp. KC345]
MTHHDHGSTVDPASAIRARLEAAFGAAFGPEYADTDPGLRKSTISDVDLQVNAFLRLARELREQPRLLALRFVRELDVADLAEVEVAGPGYLNFRLHDGVIARSVQDALADSRLAVPVTVAPKTVVVDYSSPNVAKEMHVGHLRTTVVGDAIVRVLEFLGHRVVRNNHIGDWGTQFGMLTEYLLERRSIDWDGSAVSDLTVLYKAAKKKYDSDEDFAERSRQRVVKLQSGDPVTLRVWEGLVAKSMEYFNQVYRRLGVTLTDEHIRGESTYNQMLPEVVGHLVESGHAVLSDGAWCVFPDGFPNREGQPQPFIVRKSDGGFKYETTDLAALRYRVEELHADRIIYVVGAPQSKHFEMLFAVARMAGWLPDRVTVEHAQIGNVKGSNGQILRTRDGETVRLMGLLDEAVRGAGEAYGEIVREAIDDDTRSEIADVVGISAVKFADLRVPRYREYIYAPDRMVRFQGGNTGPYLLYQVARMWSVLRKAELLPESAIAPITLGTPEERALALLLLEFGPTVQAVAASAEPHLLANYLEELAKAYSVFYRECRILGAPDPETRSSRLALCAATLRTMVVGLDLLGIRSLERM